MKSISVYSAGRGGFTVLELVATIVIIGILLSLLIPALNTVQQVAGKVRQKSQFGSIELALEAYREDMDDYPESSTTIVTAGTENYCGAQKLAEAVVGLDSFGFHPDTLWDGSGADGTGNPIYKTHAAYSALTADEKKANLAERKGPYLELETANAVELGDIYASTGILKGSTFVLADTFKNVKHALTGKKTGMPILYFKANPLMAGGYDFNGDENRDICDLGVPFDGTVHEIVKSGMYVSNLYDIFQNPNYTVYRPYRSESYILMSAGPDGYYGTLDDVFNFDSDN